MFKVNLQQDNQTIAMANCHDLRRCPRCGNVVTDPLVARCPRCWGQLPAGGCGGCTGCSMGKATAS